MSMLRTPPFLGTWALKQLCAGDVDSDLDAALAGGLERAAAAVDSGAAAELLRNWAGLTQVLDER